MELRQQGKWVWRRVRRVEVFGQLVALLGVVLLFTFGTGGQFLLWRNIQSTLTLAAVPMVLALGVHQVILLGSIDLSIQGIMALSAVVAGYLIRNVATAYDIGLWVIPIVAILGALAGFLNGVVNTKIRIPGFVATFGMWYVTLGIAVFVSRGSTVRLLDPRFQNFVNGAPLGVPNILLIALLLAVVVHILQKRTKFGTHLYAVGGDEILARRAGVRVERVKTIVFTIAGCLYAIAALLLVSRLNNANPRVGQQLLFPAITAAVVGGNALTGGIGGSMQAVLGAFIISALNSGMILMSVSPEMQGGVNGFVLVVAVATTLDRKKIGIIK